MKIGILQTGRAPENLQPIHGDYQEMSRELLGLPVESVRYYAVLDGEFPDDISECDGWFITGSRHGVYEEHDWIPPLESFIRLAQAEKRKMVGVCFGHQIMAQALGGTVEKSDEGFIVGAVNYDLLNPDFKSGDETLYAYHQDQVVSPPENSALTMTSEACEYAGLSYDEWGLSFQPHPEFSKDYVADLIDSRKGVSFSKDVAGEALNSLSTPVGNAVITKIRSFLGGRKPLNEH